MSFIIQKLLKQNPEITYRQVTFLFFYFSVPLADQMDIWTNFEELRDAGSATKILIFAVPSNYI